VNEILEVDAALCKEVDPVEVAMLFKVDVKLPLLTAVDSELVAAVYAADVEV
jgi:hypothetical protein